MGRSLGTVLIAVGCGVAGGVAGSLVVDAVGEPDETRVVESPTVVQPTQERAPGNRGRDGREDADPLDRPEPRESPSRGDAGQAGEAGRAGDDGTESAGPAAGAREDGQAGFGSQGASPTDGDRPKRASERRSAGEPVEPSSSGPPP